MTDLVLQLTDFLVKACLRASLSGRLGPIAQLDLPRCSSEALSFWDRHRSHVGPPVIGPSGMGSLRGEAGDEVDPSVDELLVVDAVRLVRLGVAL